MPFGYEAARKALSSGMTGLTSNISQMLMGDYMRKQEEQTLIAKEKRAWTQKKEELNLVFKYNKDLAKVNADLRAERDDNWKNDPYVRALQGRVGSGEATPEERAIFDGCMEIMESQSQLTPLTKDQLDFLDQVRPQFPTIAIGLYDAELKNAQFAKEIDVANQRIKAMYGGREKTAERAEATARRIERTGRIKESEKLKKGMTDINKRIFAVKEKLLKEETTAEKWYREKDELRVRTPKEEGYKATEAITSKRKLRKYKERGEEEISEPGKKGFVQPPNAVVIEGLRKQLKILEKERTIAIERTGRELELPTGERAPAEIDPIEEILNEIRAGNIPAEITEAMDADPELSFEKAVEEYIRWKLEIK